jgi:hypothetical protein
MGDEADQDVYLIAGRKLAAQFVQQGRGTFARSEKPWNGKTSIRRDGRRGMPVNGMKQLKRVRQGIDLTASLAEPLARIGQDGIDQFQLLLELLGSLSTQAIQYPGQLAYKHLGKAICGICCLERCERSIIFCRAP